ncbi:MAG TPA: ATP-binding protein, partial [Nitrospirota bacterium]
ISGLRGTVQNITERKLAEEALRDRESFIRNILESVDEGFIVVDREYRVLSANKAYCRRLNLPDTSVIGRTCYDVSHHSARPCFENGEDCPVKRTFETGAPHLVTHLHTDTNGGTRHLEIRSYPIADSSGKIVSVIETSNDVTETKKLEDQLRQAQKMEAIGTLAGGVAHDFNNILTAIIGYGNIIKLKMASGDPLQKSIDQILAVSDRAARLTQGLLAFSRKQAINTRPLDVNAIVRNVESLLRRVIGEDIELTFRLAETSLTVMADSGQIEQVLINLAVNARDAMPEGGAFIITTGEMDSAEHPIGADWTGKPGRYAVISVSDTGEGMSEKTREKIFDPFFTTKEPGKGTGLGLAIVYGIVKQHDGSINVYSELGKGTTFRIYLPLIHSTGEQTPVESAEPPRGGTETIFLAEDEESVRSLMQQTLEEYGYRVITARDGQDALDTFAARAAEIDLVILDVIMPKKSGKEVYAAVRAARPEMDVLFISGYTADIITRKGIVEEGFQLMSKPLNPPALLRKIRELLDKDKQQGRESG